MFGVIKAIFGWYIVAGLEEDCLFNNSFYPHNKPNLVYRIYKRFNRGFRLEANEYISKSDLSRKFKR